MTDACPHPPTCPARQVASSSTSMWALPVGELRSGEEGGGAASDGGRTPSPDLSGASTVTVVVERREAGHEAEMEFPR